MRTRGSEKGLVCRFAGDDPRTQLEGSQIVQLLRLWNLIQLSPHLLGHSVAERRSQRYSRPFDVGIASGSFLLRETLALLLQLIGCELRCCEQ